MKARLLSVLLALLPAVASAADPAPAAPAAPTFFAAGNRLIYTLSNGGTLMIAIEQFPSAAGPVKFRYLFSNLGPVGTITMTPEALASSTALHNYFEAGETTLTDKTSVWVSRKVFADAKAGKPVELDLGNDGKATFKLDPEGAGFLPLSIDYGRIPDGNDAIGGIPTLLLKTEDGGKFIRLFDNEDIPLILDMDTGSFRVRLSLHL